jgi:hypothetical protein
MDYEYEYGFSVRLKSSLPEEVAQALIRFAEGMVPDPLPETGTNPDEVTGEEVFRLLTLADRGGFARGISLREEGETQRRHLMVWGAATSEAFFMPFPALAEWLAGWTDTAGCGGYYHRRSLCHPTIVYFAQGQPYMLQVTGTPTGLISGDEFPAHQVGAKDIEGGEEEEETEQEDD